MYSSSLRLFEDKDERVMTRTRRSALLDALADNDAYVADLRRASRFAREVVACPRLLPRTSPGSGWRCDPDADARRSFAAMAETLDELREAHGVLGLRLRAAARGRAWSDPDDTSLWCAVASLEEGPATRAYADYTGQHGGWARLARRLRGSSWAFAELCDEFEARNGSLTPEEVAFRPLQQLSRLLRVLADAAANTPATALRGLAAAEQGVEEYREWLHCIERGAAARREQFGGE
eukprot:m51a1_g3604 hypothetical protein (236) ;mRNA; r:31174-31935